VFVFYISTPGLPTLVGKKQRQMDLLHLYFEQQKLSDATYNLKMKLCFYHWDSHLAFFCIWHLWQWKIYIPSLEKPWDLQTIAL